ncbi:Phosphatidylinositol-3,4,5-trisphosphate 3-phosphatase [Giardia lamblia P15]|uniref:Phosphatidylinositol-3,4,5-trisphosphate 3-phosphatase n=1 Tax=Giardia intestinalis (strain P15) TaxID=658858 RepID=E1EXJ8_GIAIA|nr:Phosphatidylinositol-3,4,5-trisphosphate 3-phosphatase [Giardia lamblia P15]
MSLRHLVSKNKRRYNEHGFDLDLVYVRPGLITMGYPATSIEASFRNPVKHVLRLFNSVHAEKYWVFNLCSEVKRRYHPSLFNNRVSYYGFEDHCPPPINLLVDAVNQAMSLYSTCPDVTLAIHCKAGKGRAGTVAICILLAMAYMHDSTGEISDSFSDCLLANTFDEYAKIKTYDGRAITIPSQLRYLQYFNLLIRRQFPCGRLSRITYYPRLLLKKVGIINFPVSMRKRAGKNDDLCLRIVCFSGSKEIPIDDITNHLELYNIKYSILPEGSVHDRFPDIDLAVEHSIESVHESHDVTPQTLKALKELYENENATTPLKYYNYTCSLESIVEHHVPVQSVQMVSTDDNKSADTVGNTPSNLLSSASKGERKRARSRSGLSISSKCQRGSSNTVDIYTNAVLFVSLDAVLPLSDPVILQDEIVVELTRRNSKQSLGSLRLNSYFLTSEFPFSVSSDNLLILTVPGAELDNIMSRQLWKDTTLVFVMDLIDS